ncbi:MAG TPA: hypothetical protein VIU33_04805 [Nitrospiria bacterium]
MDNRAEGYIQETFTRALLAFGIARGLNGVISVAQGTEVALQPAGVGINFTPGEILDPINDLIERFSWIMLASNASLGIQKILLEMSAWPWFSIPMAVFLVLAAAVPWVSALQASPWSWVWARIALVLILIRFAVPLVAISSELVYREFLTSQYNEAALELEETTRNIMHLNRSVGEDMPESGNRSILETAKSLYQNALSGLDMEARIESYKQAAADAARHTIDLIVVFIVQTIVFPLVFLGGVILLSKAIIRMPFPAWNSPSGPG